MILLLVLATIGHGFLWVALVNRSHAVAIPRRMIRALTFLFFLLGGGIPPVVAWVLFTAAFEAAEEAGQDPGIALPWPVTSYLGVCSVIGVWAVAQWSWRRLAALVRQPERYCRSRVSRLAPPPGEAASRALDACLTARLPGNEALCLEEVDGGVEVARLPEELSGLSILHFSDLHASGSVGGWYLDELVRRCNQRRPDLVAITGDLVDEDACVGAMSDTLAALKARYGVYFVLGNHDRRVDSQRLRRALTEGGLVDLGSRCLEVEIRGRRIVLAGNEAPWFLPAADFSQAPPSSLRGGPVRFLLTHSPDQLAWARRNEVDLVLAGHTHGGQVCLPLVGPIFVPCWHGVRHARGVFVVPPTVMHVTKGVSAEIPLRFGAMPEAVLLTLYGPGGGTPGSAGSARAPKRVR